MSALARIYSGNDITQAHVGPVRLALFISAFTVASVAIPLATHHFGVHLGRALLPMHFFALTAGVVLGWRAGLVVGAASPIVSCLLSGLPSGASLPILVIEIATYGLIAGLVQGRARNLWASLIAAMITGRVVLFIGAALLLPKPLLAYMGSVLLAGIPGMILQFGLIPPLAKKLTNWLNQHKPAC